MSERTQLGISISSRTPVTATGGVQADATTPREPIVGIDLGTTNSLVAYCDEKGPRILPDAQGRGLLPSVVRFDPQTARPAVIGFEARQHAVEFAQLTVFSVKRLMGRGLKDVRHELAYLPYQVVEGPQQTARVSMAGQQQTKVYSPQEISALILRELKQRAEAALQREVKKAVITVPAYFDDAQRQATRDAGRLAGLEVVRIVNEPTASALAYNLGQKHQDATVAVYDLGGGTFDISILRLQHVAGQGDQPGSAVDQVLSTAGDTHLGGDDVDRMIVELMQQEIRTQFGSQITFPPSTQQAFRALAEATKIRLSQQPQAEIHIELGADRVYQRVLTQAELEQMMQPWVERTLECCREALRLAKLSVTQIERVVMVGGSTRIPLVQRKVAELFGRELYTALNPDEVVALGAAVQGAILAGVHRHLLLLDVIPLSLGIETMGGAVAKLIVANSTIPARATEMFTTYVEGQTSVKIHVLQGERELAEDCRSLGQFELKGIPPMPAGLAKIEVTFLVDANGILNVSAIEKRSEIQAAIQIVPNHGLTREEVSRIEQESLIHAKADMTAHRLIDLRNQARLDLRQIERQLAKFGNLLEPALQTLIAEKVAVVKQMLEQNQPDADAFHQAMDAMDKATVRLAEIAVTSSLKELT